LVMYRHKLSLFGSKTIFFLMKKEPFYSCWKPTNREEVGI